MDTNVLYYGDNLDILRRYIPDESVDLIYLDPPFNSDRAYNVIFKNEAGNNTDAQLVAFEDTWHWGPNAEKVYAYLTNTTRHEGRVPDQVSTLIAALRKGIGENQMMAYIIEMTARLVELRRTLKPTGSLYLHCDPTASHYLKVLLDAIFGPTNFRSEIVWKRYGSHNDAKGYGAVHDVLLYYSVSRSVVFNRRFQLHGEDYVRERFRFADPDGRRWAEQNLSSPNPRPNLTYPFTAANRVTYQPPTNGWKYTPARMQELDSQGRLHYPKKVGGRLRLKSYLDETSGVPVSDVWTDVGQIGGTSSERLGYPTQKPLSLLERIIEASSNPGDVVLDPFCGCGTALIAAEKLGRKWIGIDITYLAIAVMKARLKDIFGLEAVQVLGQPTEVEGARALAQSPEGRYQFQWWALNLVDAQPVGGREKKGADRGIDGVITFTDKHGVLQTVLVSVKSGHVNSAMVRDLKGTIEREAAVIGLFLTLDEPTKEMQLEADTAGLFHSEVWNRDYPKLQILSIRELLEEGKKPQMPPFVMPTFQQAVKHAPAAGDQQDFLKGGKAS